MCSECYNSPSTSPGCSLFYKYWRSKQAAPAHGVIWVFSPTGDTMAIVSRVQLARERAATLPQLLSLALCTRRSLPRHPPEICTLCWVWQESLAQKSHLMRNKWLVFQGILIFSWSAPQEIAVMLPQVLFEVLALKMFAWKHQWFPAWLLVAVTERQGRKTHSSVVGSYWVARWVGEMCLARALEERC